MCRLPLALAALLCLSTATAEEPARWWIETELGGASTLRNDVRIPNDGGTRFALDALTGSGPGLLSRWTVERDRARHGWRAIYQPLRTRGSGRLAGPTFFAGETFSDAADTRGRYQFDTWRLTYRYSWRESDTAKLRLGFTGLVRDAVIRLEQGTTQARDANVGFVPLLHASGEWALTPAWQLAAELDGLAAPQGRAVELGLRSLHRIDEDWRLSLNLRVLEGGADNDTVYAFGAFSSLTLGLARRF